MNKINYKEAIDLMLKYNQDKNEVGVFTDNGWGEGVENDRVFSIILNGDGQNPLAYISRDTFEKLKTNRLIGSNILKTYKDRTYHEFEPDCT